MFGYGGGNLVRLVEKAPLLACKNLSGIKPEILLGHDVIVCEDVKGLELTDSRDHVSSNSDDYLTPEELDSLVNMFGELPEEKVCEESVPMMIITKKNNPLSKSKIVLILLRH
jgi:hypothetical protein